MWFATVYYYVPCNSVDLQITWALESCRSMQTANVKVNRRNCRGCGLNSFVIEWGPVAGSCGFGNEPLCFLQVPNLLLHSQVLSLMELNVICVYMYV
jgi:ribosomal protein L37E